MEFLKSDTNKPYFQKRNRLTDIENTLTITKGESAGGGEIRSFRLMYKHTISPCLFNFYAECIMRNAEEAQAGIKTAGRNTNNLRYAHDTTLMAESEEELKSLLMKVKVESEKVGLKLNIQKMNIMASSPIISWQIDGETVETVSDFIFWAPKSLKMVTAAMKLKDTYSLEGKL